MRLPLLLNVQPHPDGVTLWLSITLKWLVMHTNQHKEERLYGPTGLAGSIQARHSLHRFTAGAPVTRIWETHRENMLCQNFQYVQLLRCVYQSFMRIFQRLRI